MDGRWNILENHLNNSKLLVSYEDLSSVSKKFILEKKKKRSSGVVVHIVIPTVGRQGQEEQVFNVILGYVTNLSIA